MSTLPLPAEPPDGSGEYNFGVNLRRLRVRRKLTQLQLAQRLGWKQPQLSRYENSAEVPNAQLDTLLRLALALELGSIEELIGPLPSELLARRWRQTPPMRDPGA